MDTKNTADRIIDALGGTSETARLFQVNPAAISAWRKLGIPKARLMYLHLLRPDLFKPSDVETK